MSISYGEIDAGDLTSTRVVVLIIDKRLVGFVTWCDSNKTLEIIRVNRQFRRQGHGTFLLKLADQYAGCTLKYSGYRSTDGSKFLKALNRPLNKLVDTINSNQVGAMMEAQLIHLMLDHQLSFKENLCNL